MGRTTARCRWGSSSRDTKRTSWRRSARAAQFGAPILSRGGGTSLAGQCCNFAVVMDMSKYLHGVLHLDASGRRARVLPGHGSGRAARGRQPARPDVRPRPVDAQPLHAGRDDRQQLVRRALGHGRAHGRQRARAGDRHLRRPGDARRPDAARRAGGDHPPGRPARRDLRADEGVDRPRRPAGARALSQDPAPGVRLQPGRAVAGKRLSRRARPGRQRGDAGDGPRGDVAPGAVAARAHPAGARLPGHLHGRRPRSGGAAGRARSASRPSTTG